MAKVFISFDYTDDKHYRYLLDAISKNNKFNLNFIDYTSKEVNSDSIPVVKSVLTRKINEATHTLVLIGKNANTQHKDYNKIGYTNWINFEIAKSKEANNKIIAVKLDSTHVSPSEILSSKAEWVMSFDPEKIAKALSK